MRRLAYIAAVALVLAVPVWAQRGGHGGGGGHAGFSGGHGGGFAGHSGGARSFSGAHSGGMRSAPAASRGFNRSFNHGFTSNGQFHNGQFHNGQFHNGHFHNGQFHNFHNNCFGFACRNFAWGVPWWGWGWGYSSPWLWSTWDDEDRRFDEDYYGQYAMADQWNQRNLEEQQRMMRQEEEDGDQDAYAPRSSARRSAPTSEAQPEPMLPPTVLVFRDQHKEEVSNYAIVGQTLWNFSGQKTRKISLSDLDVAATQKANDDRGVTFRVPGASEGQ